MGWVFQHAGSMYHCTNKLSWENEMHNEPREQETPEMFLASLGGNLREQEGVDLDLAEILREHILKVSPGADAVSQAKAACGAGVLKKGEKVQFGMHNLRHSLAIYLFAVGRDIKTVQTILCRANPMTTLQLYAHGRSRDRSDAQGDMLTAFFAPPTKPSTDMVQ